MVDAFPDEIPLADFRSMDRIRGGAAGPGQPRGRYFKRLQSIKLNAQGYSLPTIRPLLDVHYNSVYQWIGRYEAEGLAGRRC